MLRKIVMLVIVVPLGILIVLAAIANRQEVTVSLDPFISGYRAFSLTQPLFVILLATLIIGVVIGGMATWLRQGKWRRAARRAGHEAASLRRESEELRRALEVAERAARGPAAVPSIAYRPPSAA
jgi:uncharacterized integral membrane protein